MANATIRDVAREANVSVASVSRVFNGRDNVRPELRTRIEAAAAKLDYVPHAGARSLSMSRTHAIGVLLPDLHGEFFSEILRGMERSASEAGLSLLLSNIQGCEDRAVETLRALRGRVDGLVMMLPEAGAGRLLEAVSASTPAVLLNYLGEAQDRPQLRIDNAAGVTTMVRHLIGIGRRRIVHLSGPKGNREAQARADAYVEALRRYGDGNLEPKIIEGDFTEDAGTGAAAEIIANPDIADALFAANDIMAVGAMTAFRDAGIAVPDRIAVAGFDDIPLARLMTPSLTTMRVDIAGIGERAVQKLAMAIGGENSSTIEHIVPQLVVRGTTSQTREDNNKKPQGG